MSGAYAINLRCPWRIMKLPVAENTSECHPNGQFSVFDANGNLQRDFGLLQLSHRVVLGHNEICLLLPMFFSHGQEGLLASHI